MNGLSWAELDRRARPLATTAPDGSFELQFTDAEEQPRDDSAGEMQFAALMRSARVTRGWIHAASGGAGGKDGGSGDAATSGFETVQGVIMADKTSVERLGVTKEGLAAVLRALIGVLEESQQEGEGSEASSGDADAAASGAASGGPPNGRRGSSNQQRSVVGRRADVLAGPDCAALPAAERESLQRLRTFLLRHSPRAVPVTNSSSSPQRSGSGQKSGQTSGQNSAGADHRSAEMSRPGPHRLPSYSVLRVETRGVQHSLFCNFETDTAEVAWTDEHRVRCGGVPGIELAIAGNRTHGACSLARDFGFFGGGLEGRGGRDDLVGLGGGGLGPNESSSSSSSSSGERGWDNPFRIDPAVVAAFLAGRHNAESLEIAVGRARRRWEAASAQVESLSRALREDEDALPGLEARAAAAREVLRHAMRGLSLLSSSHSHSAITSGGGGGGDGSPLPSSSSPSSSAGGKREEGNGDDDDDDDDDDDHDQSVVVDEVARLEDAAVAVSAADAVRGRVADGRRRMPFAELERQEAKNLLDRLASLRPMVSSAFGGSTTCSSSQSSAAQHG
jgi:hypothetical protein